MLNKHKLFLLCAKWIPVVTAIGILVTNTIAYLGNKLLTQQLNLIKTNKDKIIAESNRELETFKKFQIAAQANPNLTYKEFCENINNK